MLITDVYHPVVTLREEEKVVIGALVSIFIVIFFNSSVFDELSTE